MSADLDRLLADIANGARLVITTPTIRRIAADYAQVVAERDHWEKRARAELGLHVGMADERDRWRAIADRLGEALGQITLLDDNDVAGWNEISCALDEWRAAKEEA